MAFIPIANTVQVELVQQLDSQIIENVFHAEFSTNPSTTDIASLLDTFRTWWSTDIAPLVAPALTLENLIGTNLTTQTSARVEDTTGLPIAGSGTAAALPNNVALCITWLTDSRGRSFRGRTYQAGLMEDQVQFNDITAGVSTSFETAYANLLSDVALAGWTLVVASRFTNNAPRATGVTTDITGLRVNTTVDSQRRRLPGRGS